MTDLKKLEISVMNCELCDKQFHPACIEIMAGKLLEEHVLICGCFLPLEAIFLLYRISFKNEEVRV